MTDKKKPRLRDMIALDRAQMLPLNFTFSYILTPLYVAVALIMLIVCGSLLNAGYGVGSLICLGILGMLTAAFLFLIRCVRKSAICSEMRRYDITRCLKKRDGMESHTVWDFSENELSVSFNRYGMATNGTLFYYNHLHKLVMTSNDSKRVVICICFADREDRAVILPLSPKTLKMLDDFQIELDTQAVLDHILAHPEDAFAEIYDKGKITL